MKESGTPPNERHTILIVDDERFYLSVLKELLGPDYNIVIAKEGKQALNRAATTPQPDLILLDVMMPGMDGYEVLNKLKENPITHDIPVIFATALGSEGDEFKGLMLGAADYITKPFAPMVVQARVKTQLSLQQSQRREQEQNRKVSQKNAELEKLHQLKNQFLGMAAHDLRNPLSALLSTSTLLLDRPQLPESDKRTFLTNMKRVSEHMVTLVNDLLDISIIESGSFILNRQVGSLEKLVLERVHIARFTAQTKGTEIAFAEERILIAFFDAGRLAQVVDNLLSNAIKFSPAGSLVSVTLHESVDHVGFTVTDQGPGLSKTDKERLFGPFQRLSNQPTAGEKSTGLGLAISHKIVTAHGGSLRVESAEGNGSRFVVSLPWQYGDSPSVSQETPVCNR